MMRDNQVPKYMRGWRRCASAFLALALSASASTQTAAGVRIAIAELRDVEQTYVADGVVEAVRQSTVAAQISGRIVQINFDVGDYVKQGQVIVRIDEREVSQALAGTQAQVAQAQANLSQAKANFERQRLLFSQKFISQAAMDRAAADYKAAQAQVAATLASAGQAATTKGFAVVVAPYSGVVAARHVEIGEMAAPGKPLMTGFDPSGLRIVANVPQYKLNEISSNTQAAIDIPALGKWINASAVTVLPISDPHTLTTKARLDLPPDLKGVFPGMFARAHFVVGRATKLVIPNEAVVRRSEVTAVYVLPQQGQAQLRQVRLGVAAGKDGVEVLAGLRPGERVSLEPVKTGMVVKQAVQ